MTGGLVTVVLLKSNKNNIDIKLRLLNDVSFVLMRDLFKKRKRLPATKEDNHQPAVVYLRTKW